MSIILRSTTLNITEADIALCTDTNLLIDWKIKVDAEINSINSQIERAKIEYKEENKPADRRWFLKAQIAKKYHGQISQLLQNRLSKIRTERREANNIAHDRAFVLAAKKILSKEVFMEIVAEANYLLEIPYHEESNTNRQLK